MYTPPLLLATLAATLYFTDVGCSPVNVDTDSSKDSPLVETRNGTYAGVHNSNYNQDFFLGIPFALPPVGDLRLNLPASINSSFSGTRAATSYSPLCVGYGGDDIGYETSEDCLTINVVRPTGCKGQDLPVAVWIHGGGYIMGGSGDKRYNLTFIVENSLAINKPMIAVSFNYRLTAWGFLYSSAIQDAGVTNLGFRDQRLALHWIQENIAAFGGDPAKVTIWGESAGAGSVGAHLLAYGGRDDKLFRGVIAESGGPVQLQFQNLTYGNAVYANITASTGCNKATDTLSCLRNLPYAIINAAFNVTPSYALSPSVDGDFTRNLSSVQLNAGEFLKVPLLIGASSDEGTAFSPQGINTDAEFAASIAVEGADAATINILQYLYPDIPAIGIPATYTARPDSTVGYQFKRSAAFHGDQLMIAPRRFSNQIWSQNNVSSYAYRFNVIVNGVSDITAVTHFQEVAFVFDNLQGLGYAVNPFEGKPKSFANLAQLMCRMWVSFVVEGDPNGHGVKGIPDWPVYKDVDGYAQDFVFDANVTSHAELDTYRAEGIAFISEVLATQFYK